MAKTDLESKSVVHVAEIVQHGDRIAIPEDMNVEEAIKLLRRFQDMQEQGVSVVRAFDVFPWDGAHALGKALAIKFGWVDARPTPGFFGDEPPTFVSIATGPRSKENVLWGTMAIPGMKATLETGVKKVGKRLQFQLSASCRKKHEKEITQLFDAVEKYLERNSIYKGKAIRLTLKPEKGTVVPEPSFIDTAAIDVTQCVYPRDVEEDLQTNLFTPISRMEDCRRAGIPVQRGVMLAGGFGVGKSLAARNASRYATDSGVTYIYAMVASELAEVLEFARQYAPAVVFCEDIDRAVSGERSVPMDELLNTMSGVASKGAEIITVLTTNEPEKINPAMLRPGRLDAVIEIKKPDAAAVERLIRLYGGANVDPTADLEEVSLSLMGNIPSVIEEVVKRSKLSQLALTKPGEKLGMITAKALSQAADSMRLQLGLLEGNKPEPEPTMDKVFRMQREQTVGDVQAAVRTMLSKAGFNIPA